MIHGNYLIEPYNAYAPKGARKKHLHEILEEQALLERIIMEQQAQQALLEATNTNNASVGHAASATSAGGAMHLYNVFNPTIDPISFTGTPVTGDAPLMVKFTNTSNGQNVHAYTWTFGDGTNTTTTSPNHIYNTGSFTVKLTASYLIGGISSSVAQNYISASIPTVVSNFNISTGSVGSGSNKVTWTNLSTNSSQTPTTTYKWDFGSGSLTSSLKSPTPITYTTTGSYIASLQTTGSYNIASIFSRSFVINNLT